jgi:hypothetical protein
MEKTNKIQVKKIIAETVRSIIAEESRYGYSYGINGWEEYDKYPDYPGPDHGSHGNIEYHQMPYSVDTKNFSLSIGEEGDGDFLFTVWTDNKELINTIKSLPNEYGWADDNHRDKKGRWGADFIYDDMLPLINGTNNNNGSPIVIEFIKAVKEGKEDYELYMNNYGAWVSDYYDLYSDDY